MNQIDFATAHAAARARSEAQRQDHFQDIKKRRAAQAGVVTMVIRQDVVPTSRKAVGEGYRSLSGANRDCGCGDK